MEHRSGVCYAFQKGKCHFGARCRYSHDLTARNTPQGPEKDGPVPLELKKSKDQVFQRSSLGYGLGWSLSQASHLGQLNDSCRQELVKSLVTDRGLEKVLKVVDQDCEGVSERLRCTPSIPVLSLLCPF
jgi:hypothetical protein